MATSVSWNDLPDVALVKIYLDLTDTDRLNVALTCKNWQRSFYSAVLWRRRRVVFESLEAERDAEKENKFLDKFGHCLHRLSINIGQPNFKSCLVISKALDMYAKRMCGRNDIRLRELELENFHLEQHWHFILSRNRLVTALCRIIRKQKCLRSVFMAGARMRLVDGCRVMEALSKGPSGRTITHVYMEDFFEMNIIPYRALRFVTAMSKFATLKQLHCNYRYLNGDVIRNIANKIGRQFENLSLIIEGDVRGVEVPTDVWVEFAERCPRAEVGIYICTTIMRGADLRTPFVRGLPLTSVYLTSWSRVGEVEFRLASLLRHLGHMYNTSLGKPIV